MAVHVVRTQGVLALYNGLSASLTRQVICLLLNKGMPHYIYRVFMKEERYFFNNFGHD